MTKGQVEDSITKFMIQWEKDFMGRGPTKAKTDVVRDLIVVSLMGVLSTAETRLAIDNDGRALVKEIRQLLVEQGRTELVEAVSRLSAAQVISLHTDISTKTGERIFVFRLDRVV